MDVYRLVKALRCVENRQLLPAEFDQLICLSDQTTPLARANKLWNMLQSQTLKMLSSYQTAHSYNSPNALQDAFEAKDVQQQIWLTLYWRYFHPTYTYKLRQIAFELRISQKLLRRRWYEGLTQLLEWLQKREAQERSQYFQNRQIALARRRLTDRLSNEQQQRATKISDLFGRKAFFIIEGMAGIGKSSIALHLYSSLEQTYDVIWVEAQPEYLDRYMRIQPLPESARTAEAVIQQIYRSTELFDHPDIERQLAAIEMYPSPLVILINRVDALEQGERDKLMGYLERLTAHTFILTSRCALEHPYAKMIRVPELTDNQSLEVLDYARRCASGNTSNLFLTTSFSPLYELVGGVPLALVTLGTYCAHTPVKQALEELQQARPPFDTLYEYFFRRTWQQLSANAREVLRYLASESISNWISQRWLCNRDLGPQAADAVNELNKHHLIEIDANANPRSIKLRPLVRTALRSGIWQTW